MNANPHTQRHIVPILEELNQLVQSVDSTLMDQTMKPVIHQLQSQLQSKDLSEDICIWVGVYGEANQLEIDCLRNYLGTSDLNFSQQQTELKTIDNIKIIYNSNLSSLDFDYMASKKPIAGFFLISSSATDDKAFIYDHLFHCISLMPIAVVVSDPEWRKFILSQNRSVSQVVIHEDWNEFQQSSLQKDTLVLTNPKVSELAQSVGQLETLHSANNLAQKLLQNLEFDIKAKSQNTQQEEVSNKLISKGISSSSNIFKQKLQTRIEQFDRMAQEESQIELTPISGNIYQLLEKAIKQMPPLSEEKRAKKISSVIPETFKQEYLAYFHKLLFQYCEKSRLNARLFAESLSTQVQQIAAQYSITLTLPNPILPDPQKMGEIIQLTLRIERTFEGAAIKKKPMELLSGARMYLMMFMMLATMFGIGSFLRNNTLYYIPFTIILIGLGVWIYLDAHHKEKAELREKFQEDAMENLKSESKRMLQDFARQWERYSIQPLRDWSKVVEREAQSAFENAEKQSGNLREQESHRIKSIIDALKAQESNIAAANRSKNAIEKNLNKARIDIYNLLRAQLTNFHVKEKIETALPHEPQNRRTNLT